MSANIDPQYVLSNDPPAPEQTEQTDQSVDQTPDPAALQAQIDQLSMKIEYEAKLREKAEEQSAFWFNAANKKLEAQEPPQQRAQPPSAPPELSEERYNLILSKPEEMQKYIDEVADYKARTISQQVASTVADEKANQITGDQRRLQSAWVGEVQRLRQAGATAFGVAGDPITDLFAQKVQAMMQDPTYAHIDPVIAMKLAISEAEADFLRSGGVMQPGQQQQPQEEGQPPAPSFPRTLTGLQQQQRNAAIAAQAPSKGRKAAPPEKFSNISPDQMAMLQKHAAGLGLPVEKLIEQMPRVVKFRG